MGEMALQNKILDQLDGVLTKYRELKARSQHEDCSDQPEIAVTTLNMLMSDGYQQICASEQSIH
jgi:hypothetical protein